MHRFEEGGAAIRVQRSRFTAAQTI